MSPLYLCQLAFVGLVKTEHLCYTDGRWSDSTPFVRWSFTTWENASVMKQSAFIEEQDQSSVETTKRRGPPNRMNDMKYSDWMKFQKSFFRYDSTQALVEECIFFFTKAVWPDGKPSRSLVVGFEDFRADSISAPRLVRAHNSCHSFEGVVTVLEGLARSEQPYDVLLVDLRRHIPDRGKLALFLSQYSDRMFEAIRRLLVPDKYCGILVDMEEKGGGGFPLPWAVAMACRDKLRLRDEKIGLMEDQERVFYCLFMQTTDDKRPAYHLLPDTVHLRRPKTAIPAWLIPKSPPRKKNEVLHPAKYPETLIGDFIELFTDPGDAVFDPMLGTGSTVVAALRTGRDGYGTELLQEFADIARHRVQEEAAHHTLPGFFPELDAQRKGVVVCGDATRLGEIEELAGVKFAYSVTSPPYWSMLQNPGSEGQRGRRQKNLKLVYSNDSRDLGNVQDYDEFLASLERVYDQVAEKLTDNGVLTVIVKNVKREHIVYPLAWDLLIRLCGSSGKYDYLGTTLWCQDDVSLKPFAVGIHWVSNTLHHYCMHFTKRVE